MFVLLPLSDKGLPESLEEKISIINTILEKAYELGFTKEDDPEKIEYELMRKLPKDHWILYNIQVISFGRKYKNHWFALAMYDETLDVWTYFGNNSTTEKYIGWTYVVEWYDKDGRMIDTDKIRINLSNADCHLALDPYYG